MDAFYKKNVLMFFCVPFAVGMSTGCGSDADSGDNKQCGGHGQPSCDEITSFDLLDSGYVSWDYVLDLGSNEVVSNGIGAAFYTTTWPQKIEAALVGSCENWGTQDGAFWENLSSKRVYREDIGPSITLTHEDTVFVVEGSTATPGQYFTQPSLDKIKFDATYEIKAGNLTYSEGLSVTGQRLENKATLYMPDHTTITSPAVVNGAVTLPANDNARFEWNHESPAGGDLGFVWLGAGDGSGDTFFCISNPNAGGVDIPKAVLDRVTNSGWAYVGALMHNAFKIGENQKIDSVAYNCNAISWEKN